jgi:signal transduction histidine kinase
LRDLECGRDEFRRALETEKLEALKELAYGASHEINNPLANISARAQTLLRDERDPQRRRMLSAIHTQAMRAHEMIADLMLFARPPKLVRKCVNLVQLVDDAVAELSEHAVRQQATIEHQGVRKPVMLLADDVQLGVVLRAMGTNALEAISAGGYVHLEVRVDTAAADETRWAQVIVADNGPGIPPQVRRHLFDPFFSGREAGRGLGFGLSKCWRIVTDHGGRIDVDSPTAGGAIFTVSLPIDRRP